MNIRSLVLHFGDAVNDPVLDKTRVLIFSETWFSEQINSCKFTPRGFSKLFRADRQLQMNEKRRAGGVVVCVKDDVNCNIIQSYCSKEMQILVLSVASEDFEPFHLVSVYRSPSFPPRLFIDKFKSMLGHVNAPTLIYGDINQDLFRSDCTIEQNMNNCSFDQLINVPTHISGSCIDHVYVKGVNAVCNIYDCAYSDHDWVVTKVFLKQI